MKFSSCIVLAAFVASSSAVTLKNDPDAFFAREQKWSELQDSQKEVKAAKERVELEQLKKDTEASLKEADRLRAIERESGRFVQEHNKVTNQQVEVDHNSQSIQRGDYVSQYTKQHGFEPSQFTIVSATAE